MPDPAAHPGVRPDRPLLCIVHADPGFVVVDKPPGLRSVPARGSDTDPDRRDSVEHRVRLAFPDASGPVSVHRLDHETSGLIVAGLTRAAHRALSRQFMHRKVGKSYEALLDGLVEPDEGAIDLPLAVDWPNRPRHALDWTNGRTARTLFRVVDRGTLHAVAPGLAEASPPPPPDAIDPHRRPVTRVRFRPETGRTHQIRLHAALPRSVEGPGGSPVPGGLGCPILGDVLYNPRPADPRLMLHAHHLAFWAPDTGAWVKFDSPVPF